jgi:hypothetical protein
MADTYDAAPVEAGAPEEQAPAADGRSGDTCHRCGKVCVLERLSKAV